MLVVVAQGAWQQPRRRRHLDLTLEADGGDDGESGSESDANVDAIDMRAEAGD